MAFQATLTGNIGREPEIRYFESGKCKVELTVAIKQNKKDAPAFWVQVDMWNKQAEFAQNYLHKGDTIFAQGTVTEETFTRRNGEAGHKVVLVFAQFEILKSAQPRTGTEFVPTEKPAANPPVKVVEQNPQYVSNDPLVPEVDEIPF